MVEHRKYCEHWLRKLEGIDEYTRINKSKINGFYETFAIDHIDLLMNHQHLFGTIKNSLSHPIFRKCYRVECYGWNGSLNTEEMNFIRRNIDLRHGFKVRCQCEESFNKELVSIGLFLFSKHKILFSYSIFLKLKLYMPNLFLREILREWSVK